MFIDRENELASLEKQYNNNRSNFIVIYGRRRIGKTFLINEFVKDKPNIYFSGTQESKTELIKKFSVKLSTYFKDEIITKNPLNSWDSIFEYIIKNTENLKEKLIVTIDEITYIRAADPSFLSIFQMYYDMHFKDMNIMFIMSGSLINIIYSKIFAYSSPVYGRRTGNIELNEFTFPTLSQYFKNISMEQLVNIYSLFGGIPYYLSLIDPETDIIDQYICKGNIYYNDAEFILREELSNPERYFTILKLIASGKNRVSELGSAMQYNSNELSPYLDKLNSLGIIKKEYPLYNKKRNNGIYKIKSNYFDFYFKFIFENKEYINDFQKDIIKSIINTGLKEYISKVYESICTQFLLKFADGLIGSSMVEIGKWWGKNKNKDKGNDMEEIDIIGKDTLNRHIFGEVKYRNRKTGIEVLNELKRKSTLFPFSDVIYIIFSFNGFENDLISLANIEKNLVLVDSHDMGTMLKLIN